MKMKGGEELGKHLDKFIKNHEDDKDPAMAKSHSGQATPFLPALVFLSYSSTRPAYTQSTVYLLGIDAFLYQHHHPMQLMQCLMHRMNS